MVLIERQSRTGIIILNRPEKRNALNPEMVDALKKAMRELLEDDSVKVILIRANGDVFCSGADLDYLKQIRHNSLEDNRADSQNLRELFDLIYDASKLTLAEVGGPALAGGCGLATICDFCYASPDATFGYTEAKIGFVPALVLVYLSQKIQGTRIRELMLTGHILNAEEAMEIGLINGIHMHGDLHSEMLDFAEKLSLSVSGQSVQSIKTLLRALPGKSMEQALDYAVDMNAQARASEDCIRGVDAFLNKEKIQW